MQQPVGASQAGLGLRRASVQDAGTPVDAARAATPAWGETVLLAVVYVVSILSLAGFATFGVHPELLARAEVSPATYGRILVWAPRAQILVACAALVTFLVTRAGGRWVPAFAVVYVLSLGAELAGTTFLFFVVANLLKVGPWLLLVDPTREFYALLALSVPVIVLGTWNGWLLHKRIDQSQLYRACYGLLVIVALKLLWDGLKGYGLL